LPSGKFVYWLLAAAQPPLATVSGAGRLQQLSRRSQPKECRSLAAAQPLLATEGVQVARSIPAAARNQQSAGRSQQLTRRLQPTLAQPWAFQKCRLLAAAQPPLATSRMQVARSSSATARNQESAGHLQQLSRRSQSALAQPCALQESLS